MLQWRLKAYRHWASLEKAQAEPKWANVKYGPIGSACAFSSDAQWRYAFHSQQKA